jgi:uncharacterized membrane protein
MKQSVSVNFSSGLDLKTDPYQLPIGRFLSLKNTVFTVGGRLTKRNGYGTFTDLPLAASFLTTFNGNLTAIGSNIQAYVAGTNTWVNKGALEPVELSTLPLIRSNTNQSQVDTAIASNGLICTVYTDQTPTSLSTPRYMYAVADSVTGQNVVSPTVIPASSGSVNGSPRVFALGAYFIIGFSTSTNHLQYIAVSIANPSLVTTAVDISSSVSSSSGLSWDGAVVGNSLYLAYYTTSGGSAIHITYLSSSLILQASTVYSDAGKVTATIMSVAIDNSTPSNPIIWAAYYNSGTSTGYAFAVNSNLQKC